MVEMTSTDNMDFEAHEIERGFDLANLTFGAFLGAYMGFQLTQKEPTSYEMFVIACLLGAIALTAHALRSFAVIFVRGNGTTRHTIFSVVTFFLGCATYTLIIRELDYPIAVMGTIGVGWISTCALVSGLMISRRWIKIYD